MCLDLKEKSGDSLWQVQFQRTEFVMCLVLYPEKAPDEERELCFRRRTFLFKADELFDHHNSKFGVQLCHSK